MMKRVPALAAIGAGTGGAIVATTLTVGGAAFSSVIVKCGTPGALLRDQEP
jgi:hypothetical protein